MTGTSSAATATANNSTLEQAGPARRTTAHDHRQLAQALGWQQVQVTKAVVHGGILPPYDLKTPRWRAVTVDALVERREELTAAMAAADAALLTEAEMIETLGLEWGDWRRGRDHDILPAPDADDFWTRAQADDLAACVQELREQIPPQPLGVTRCAGLLAELTGLPVTDEDLRVLIRDGHIPEAGYFKKWTLYDVAAVRALAATDDGVALVASTIAERQACSLSSQRVEAQTHQ